MTSDGVTSPIFAEAVNNEFTNAGNAEAEAAFFLGRKNDRKFPRLIDHQWFRTISRWWAHQDSNLGPAD
jgi:hypothetical protein